jgi:hypothetical protein
MDYFISLIDEDKGAEQHYSEQVVHMQWVNAPTLRLVRGTGMRRRVRKDN